MKLRYVDQIPRVFGLVLGNRDLRRVETAFVAFNAAEWAVWIAMLVYAYERGGSTEAGIVAFVQLAPAAVVAHLTGGLADRHPPARVLAASYLVQAAAMGATAAALLLHGPAPLSYALAAVAASAVTVTRPAQATLLPVLARMPEELTAANVVSGWIESAMILVAPAVAGVILSVGGPGDVVAAMAAVVLLGTVAVARVAGPPPAGEAATAERRDPGPAPRLLVGLLASQSVLVGALDVLFVVLAIGVLGLGGSGAGYLNAAFGAGGTLGIAATVALVGRRRLSPLLAAGGAAFSLAFVVIGLWSTTAGTILLLALAGAGRSLFDVAGRTLLQRSAPSDQLGRLFGLVEALSMVGLAVGSLLVPALIGVGGVGTACIVLGLLMPVVAAVRGRAVLALDEAATVPVVEVALLRSIPLFAPLGVPAIEQLASRLEPIHVGAGETVIRSGEVGDRFYIVADGRFEARQDGRVVREVCRGDGFGELALLRDVPRTADVVALTPGHLHALGKADFLEAVTGHPGARSEADRLVRERLPAGATIAP
ncbi:MAG TPA: MFS transporter [Gaiellaceae bacterium]